MKQTEGWRQMNRMARLKKALTNGLGKKRTKEKGRETLNEQIEKRLNKLLKLEEEKEGKWKERYKEQM